MDHSLQGYLERRETAELEAILNYAINSDNNIPEDVSDMIIAILEKRKQETENKIAPK